MRIPKWALLVLAALLIGFMLGGATAKDGFLFGPTVAAWAQFCGSMVAMAAAIFIAHGQTRATLTLGDQQALQIERKDLVAKAEILQAAHKLLIDGRAEMKRAEGIKAPSIASPENFEGLANALEAFPHHALPGEGSGAAVVAARIALQRYYSRHRTIARGHRRGDLSEARERQLRDRMRRDVIDVDAASTLLAAHILKLLTEISSLDSAIGETKSRKLFGR